MYKNVKQNVLFEQSEFTFCSFCMWNYFMFFLVTRHSQVNLPLRSLLEKIPTGNQVGRCIAETKRPWFGPWIFLLRLGIINAGHFDKLSDRIASALAAQETRQAQGPKRSDKRPLTFDFWLATLFGEAIGRFNNKYFCFSVIICNFVRICAYNNGISLNLFKKEILTSTILC